MSLVNLRAVSERLNMLVQNQMQNSHAAITGHKTGRGVTWDPFWTICPIHKGWGRKGRPCWVSLRNASHSTYRQVPPLLNPWWEFATLDRQTRNEIAQKWPPAVVGGQAQFPDALILLGSNSPHAYRGSHCTATIPLVLLNKAVLLPGWAVPPPLKGRSSICSPSWLKWDVWQALALPPWTAV